MELCLVVESAAFQFAKGGNCKNDTLSCTCGVVTLASQVYAGTYASTNQALILY